MTRRNAAVRSSRVAWVDEDPDVARERLQEFFDRLVQNYRDRNAMIPAAMQEAVNGDFEEFADGRLIYGDPEECVDRIEEFEDRLGIDHMVLKLYNPGVDHEQMMEFIELLGEGSFHTLGVTPSKSPPPSPQCVGEYA